MLRINGVFRASVLRCRLVPLVLLMPLSLQAEPDRHPQARPDGLVIREIRIQGLQTTREEIVRGQLVSHVGGPYSEATAKQDYQWLDRLGVFSSIRITPTVDQDEVLLVVEVQETPRILAYPSFDVTGENGVSAGFGAKAPSFLRRATPLSGSARFGPLTETEMLWESAWRRNQKFWFVLRYNYRDRPNESFHFQENAHEPEFKGGIQFRQNWKAGVRFTFISMGSDTPGKTLSRENRDSIPGLGGVLQYDGRDLRSNPHHGWQSSFDITQNGGWVGGDGSFVTVQFDIRRYQRLAARHVIALFSFATLQSGSVGITLPIYRTYTIGGTNTVRGWQMNARQGKNQYLNTLEYRYDLLPPKSFRVHRLGFYLGLQLAAFGDLGTAWNVGEDFTRNMIGGVGFGLRVIIPFVDMIRFDFGLGQSEHGVLSCIGIGEKADYGRERVR